MTNRSRRALLCGVTGALTLVAGCIAEESDGSSPAEEDDGLDEDDNAMDDESGSDDDSDDGNDSNGDDSDDERSSIETRPFEHTDPTSEPTATLFRDRETADGWLDERRVEEGGVHEFVGETPFETASLVAVEVGVPNLCYEPTVDSADVEDEALDLEVAVVEDGSEGCGQQMATVGVLVRASSDGEPVRSGSVTLIGHEGETHEIDVDDG